MKASLYLYIILNLLVSNVLSGQQTQKKITISGIVMDVDRKPVQGAAIFVDNRETNVLTNENGFYKIRVNSKAKTVSVLTVMNGVSEVEIGGRTNINFIMKTPLSTDKQLIENSSGEETVNVGYGTMKKKDMTTSVGKIDGTKKRFSGYQNIYEMIKGEVPGVQVNGNSIMIQGPSSIRASTEPLFVVDNVIVSSVDGILPQMVRSIEVLKGAAAAIYGSRGANGVILIYLNGATDKKR
jgi:TonB-dependent SusC/RagA subfamily outer membrane receptor